MRERECIIINIVTVSSVYSCAMAKRFDGGEDS